MKTSYEVNKLQYDEFGRPSGLLLIDKPAGLSSHDIVNQARKILSFKKIGHAGALDVFSSGLLLILVGKATKLSDELLNKDKAYETRVVFGIKTETQDTEGQVLELKKDLQLDQKQVEQAVQSFSGGYEQYVSIYSSVKVEGNKLRKILRDPAWSHELIVNKESKTLKFVKKDNAEKIYEINVPKREIKIHEIKLNGFGLVAGKDLPFIDIPETEPDTKFFYADVFVKCSKGTYIRQFGEDLAERLGTVAALSSLRRVELGPWNQTEAITTEAILKQG